MREQPILEILLYKQPYLNKLKSGDANPLKDSAALKAWRLPKRDARDRRVILVNFLSGIRVFVAVLLLLLAITSQPWIGYSTRYCRTELLVYSVQLTL